MSLDLGTGGGTTMLYESLREMVAVHGVGLLADGDDFRAALDDFLDESEATVGEINLLVDAVRLDALRRLTSVLDHGADVDAAVRQAGASLARDRGSDDLGRASWAVAVIGFAAGRLETDHLPVRPPPSVGSDVPGDWTEGADPVPDAAAVTDVAPRNASEVRAPGPIPVDRAPTVGPGGDRPSSAQRLVGDWQSTPAEPPVRDHNRFLIPGLVVLVAVLLAAVTGLVVARTSRTDDATGPTASDSGASTDGAGRSGKRGNDQQPSDESPTVTSPSSTAPVSDGSTIPDSDLLVDYFVDDVHQIYEVDTSTNGIRPVMGDGQDDELPSISPDRATISFIRKPGGDDLEQVVWLADADGSNQRILYDGTECTFSTRPGWSEDGSQIAVSCFAGDDTTGLFVSEADGSGLHEVLPAPQSSDFLGAPTWISDHEVVYSRSDHGRPSQLWRLDVTTGDTSPLFVPNTSWNSRPDWSAESGQLLFMSTTSETNVFGQVMTWSPGASETDVLDAGVQVAHPVWSPDGEKIAVCVSGSGGAQELAVLDASSPSSITVVPSPPSATAGAPVWASR